MAVFHINVHPIFYPSVSRQQLPSRLPLNPYPCSDLGYLAVPELLLSQSVASYGQGVKMDSTAELSAQFFLFKQLQPSPSTAWERLGTNPVPASLLGTESSAVALTWPLLTH